MDEMRAKSTDGGRNQVLDAVSTYVEHRARLAQSHCHNLDGTLLDARGSVFVLERNPYPEDLGVLHVPPRLAQPRHPFGRPTCEHQECALSAANLPRDGKVDAGWI